jgi:antitoxin component YwqK of YwqJK toxin-antitoxin module
MKYFLILIVSFSFTTAAIAQQNYPDRGFTNKAEAKNLMVNGLKEGKWVEYLVGGSVTNDTNATWYRLCIYKSGKINRLSIIFYQDEHADVKYKAGEMPYSNGVINRMRKDYFFNGKLRMEFPYVNGEINDVAKGYYENGKLYVEEPYRNGKENGIVKGYYANGKLMSESPFNEGKENGVEKGYYENGNLEYETTHRNDTIIAKNYWEKETKIK